MSDTPHSSPETQPGKKRWLSRPQARAVREIAAQLNETEKRAIAKIRLIIFRMGVEFAQAVLQETLDIEAQGGLMVADGSRRRTPGGVFFSLVKQRLPPDTRKEIFPPIRHRRRKPSVAPSPHVDAAS